MALQKEYIPQLPFPTFKWKWATSTCREGLNDPVVLLGVLKRMRSFDNQHISYSSTEFFDSLTDLAAQIGSETGVNVRGNSPERNIVRNQKQYWTGLGLVKDIDGEIALTDFGRRVADNEISKAEFAAVTIKTFKLPNRFIRVEDRSIWERYHIAIYPLILILNIIREMYGRCSAEGYLTTDELTRIVIPLSGTNEATTSDYCNFLEWYRQGELNLTSWPNCVPGSNDSRIAREFLLFLSNYGYLIRSGTQRNNQQRFTYNAILDDEIKEITRTPRERSVESTLLLLRDTPVVSDMERKRVRQISSRPNQAKFRKEVLSHFDHCIITNATMPEVLEAAHIKPFKYKGADIYQNGFPMRMDIHQLFDSGHLRISDSGVVELSQRARIDYGMTIPRQIVLPEYVDLDNIRWRWNNYRGI